jgi:L-aminopeptidase/D-esterase-like protein
VSTGTVPADVNVVGAMAAICMEKAIIRAVKMSKSAYGLPAFGDL